MKAHLLLAASMVSVALWLVSTESSRAGELMSNVDNDWFRGWPPAEVTYSFPAEVHEGDRKLGEIDTLSFHVSYIESLKGWDEFNWLVGVDWRRTQAIVADNSPVPNTLQSAAAVVGFEWRFRERWRARLEVAPGVYSDFADLSGDNFNAPFTFEISYSLSPNLLFGVNVSVDARRDSPLVGFPGVRWKFADQWLLSLWVPRPQIEFQPVEHVTLFGGVSFGGGTYVVAGDFGRRRGRADLDNQAVDFREVRVGGGVRYDIRRKLALEIGGGWTVDRRYHFHERDLLLNGEGAPYAEFSFGLTF
jgi:hypothetical protein